MTTSPQPLPERRSSIPAENHLLNFRRALEARRERSEAEDRSSITLRECFEEYKHPQMVARDRRQTTIDDYKRSIDLWEQHSDNPVVARITHSAITRWQLQLLQEVKLERSTVDKHTRNVRAMLSSIGPDKEGLLSRVPRMEPLESNNVRTKPPIPIDERIRLYNACRVARQPGKRLTPIPAPLLWRTVFVFLESYGWRPSDLGHGGNFVEGVRNEGIDLDSGVVDVVLQKTKRFAGGQHMVPVTEPVRVHVEACREFVGRREGPLFPIHKTVWYDEINAIVRAAELDWEPTAYNWRQATNEAWYEAGSDGEFWTGHALSGTNKKHYLGVPGRLRVMNKHLPFREFDARFTTID